MNDNCEEYQVSQVQIHNSSGGDTTIQQTLEDAFRTAYDTTNVTANVDDGNPANQFQYYERFRDDSNGSGAVHSHSGQYEEDSIQYQHIHGGMDHSASNMVAKPTGINDQYLHNSSQSAAAVPIPAMALQVSNLSHNYTKGLSGVGGHPMTSTGDTNARDGAPPVPRCVEEDYAIILHRSSSATAKSSNTKYRCMFCSFTFVGGPQKIRVHLTGKRENGTRLSRCEHCPEDVRRRLEERMKAPRETANAVGMYDDDESDAPSLPPRNVEEHHTTVLSRSQSSNSKSSNTRYKCIYCRYKFVGGPQKIRVHLTGQQEGGTRMQKCARAPEEVVLQMEHRRKAPKPDLLATPGGSADAVTSSASASSSQAHVVSSASMMTGVTQPPTAQSRHQAFVISQQQQALHDQQQHHAAQLQIQQQQLQQLQRQQQFQQRLHAQQQIQQQEHIQHLQQLHQHQMQAQMHQQQMQHSLHGVHLLNAHPTPAQVLMYQQQLLQHPQLAHHLAQRQPIPPHLQFHNSSSAFATNLTPRTQSLQAEELSSPQQTHAGVSQHILPPAVRLGYDRHSEAAYYAELQQHLQVSHAAAQRALPISLAQTNAQTSNDARQSPTASPTPGGRASAPVATSTPAEDHVE
jgi:DNA-directed RNA polymerase subunit RPC12/RpoP